MKYKNIIKVITIVFFFSFLMFNFNSINAATPEPVNPLEKLETVAKDQAGYAAVTEDSPRIIIAKIVKTILSLLGILFLILIIISGYQWMTAGGNEETLAKAKKRIINATIGLAVIILAYSIHVFVLETLLLS